MLPVSSNNWMPGSISFLLSSTNLILLVSFVRELPDELDAIPQRLTDGITPAGRQERRCLLIDFAIGNSEKAQVLTLGRRGEFLYGDVKIDFGVILAFLDRKAMDQRQFLEPVSMNIAPLHRLGPPQRVGESSRALLAALRILGWAQRQVNVQKDEGFGSGEFGGYCEWVPGGRSLPALNNMVGRAKVAKILAKAGAFCGRIA